MYYLDGSTPAEHVWRRVLEMMESENGAIAIHCKAGLGRAGTMCALYIMKHYRFTAAEAIGWLRVCRPGTIIGPQQHYLKSMEPTI